VGGGPVCEGGGPIPCYSSGGTGVMSFLVGKDEITTRSYGGRRGKFLPPKTSFLGVRGKGGGGKGVSTFFIRFGGGGKRNHSISIFIL